MLISSWIFVTTFITIVKFNIVLKDLNLEMININAEIIIQRMIKLEKYLRIIRTILIILVAISFIDKQY